MNLAERVAEYLDDMNPWGELDSAVVAPEVVKMVADPLLAELAKAIEQIHDEWHFEDRIDPWTECPHCWHSFPAYFGAKP